MNRFDVAVVGAGHAGSAFAGSLAELGFSVALVDRARFPRAKPCAAPVLDHVAQRLQAKPHLADLLVGITGDFVPLMEVLRPAVTVQLAW